VRVILKTVITAFLFHIKSYSYHTLSFDLWKITNFFFTIWIYMMLVEFISQATLNNSLKRKEP